MSGPIANPRHDPARTRRRQSFFSLLRTTLAIALILACVAWFPRLVEAVRSAEQAIAPPAPPLASGDQIQVSGPAGTQVTGLAPGACLSFAPVAGANGKTVFVDPGHGGLDSGAVGDFGGRTVMEKDLTLAVATDLTARLRADGYRVVMARTQDTPVAKLGASDSAGGSLSADAVRRDLLARAACANASGATVLVSIHFDGFSDPAVNGTETFYDAARAFAPENKRLAFDLQGSLVTALRTSDRGVWADDQLDAPALSGSGSRYGHLIELGPALGGWVDRPSQMPGALVEPLFVTNPQEARFAADPNGQQAIAAALAAGLGKYFAGA